MFIYQLKNRGKLGNKKFAINELYRLYYQKADGKGEPPVLKRDEARLNRIGIPKSGSF
jgi:hypothetical protein